MGRIGGVPLTSNVGEDNAFAPRSVLGYMEQQRGYVMYLFLQY
jgi:hypothetical protein